MNTQMHETAYAIPESLGGDDLVTALKDQLDIEVEQDTGRRVTYFDTFDWRLHRDGGSLSLAPGRGGRSLCWQSHDRNPRHQMLAETAPPFVWNFPAGPFRRALEPVIQMRRLLPVVELRLGGQTFRVLDTRQKTLVRLRLEEGTAKIPGESPEPTPLPGTLRVLPVRGYLKAYNRVIRLLESELGLTESPVSEFGRALAAVGRQAGDYVSKVVLDLDSAMPAAEAAKAIHTSLLKTIQRNESGTRRDLDSEFLHDFRVAVRRTRSALSQIKGIYPAADLEYFKSEFKWLGGLTGPVRDLDVYLLKMDDYKAELPEAVRDDLAPLEDYLVDRQRREQRRMARHLGAKRYRDLLEAWAQFLSQPADLETAPNAGRPIGRVASERIWKVYRRVLKRGLAIDDDTPAGAVHDLRIECKKLRYLMEFFRGLYDRPRITQLIKALKQLQDNLGDFNDYEVQQGSLKEFADDMASRQAAPAATLMAMGRLVEFLEKGQARERHDFGRRFAKFAREENRLLARDLFAPV